MIELLVMHEGIALHLPHVLMIRLNTVKEVAEWLYCLVNTLYHLVWTCACLPLVCGCGYDMCWCHHLLVKLIFICECVHLCCNVCYNAEQTHLMHCYDSLQMLLYHNSVFIISYCILLWKVLVPVKSSSPNHKSYMLQWLMCANLILTDIAIVCYTSI